MYTCTWFVMWHKTSEPIQIFESKIYSTNSTGIFEWMILTSQIFIVNQNIQCNHSRMFFESYESCIFVVNQTVQQKLNRTIWFADAHELWLKTNYSFELILFYQIKNTQWIEFTSSFLSESRFVAQNMNCHILELMIFYSESNVLRKLLDS